MLTFDGNEWQNLELDQKELEAMEDVQSKERLLQCGHWRVGIAHPTYQQRFGGCYWAYVVCAEARDMNPEDEPLLIESVLVRDFPSLLKLLAMLNAADIQPTNQPSY